MSTRSIFADSTKSKLVLKGKQNAQELIDEETVPGEPVELHLTFEPTAARPRGGGIHGSFTSARGTCEFSSKTQRAFFECASQPQRLIDSRIERADTLEMAPNPHAMPARSRVESTHNQACTCGFVL
jgi:hypothetical protein